MSTIDGLLRRYEKHIDKLEKQIETERSQHADTRDAMTDLQYKLSAQERDIADLERKNRTYVEELKEANIHIEHISTDLKATSLELNTACGLLDDIEYERQQSKVDLENQRKSLKQQKRKIEALVEKERKEFDSKIKHLKHNLERHYKREIDSINSRWEMRLDEFSSQAKLQRESEKAKSALAIESLKAENKEYERQTRRQKELIVQNESQIAQLEKELRRSELENSIPGVSNIENIKEYAMGAETRNRIFGLERKVNRLRTQILEQGDEISLLTSSKKNLEQKLREVQNQLAEEQSKNQELESKNGTTERKFEKEIISLKDRLEQKHRAISLYDENWQKRLAQINEQNDETTKGLERTIVTLEESVKEHRAQVDKVAESFERKLKEERKVIAKLEEEVRKYTQELREVQREYAYSKEREAQLAKQLATEKEQTQILMRRSNEMETNAEQLAKTIRRLETRI